MEDLSQDRHLVRVCPGDFFCFRPSIFSLTCIGEAFNDRLEGVTFSRKERKKWMAGSGLCFADVFLLSVI